ncbi:MAG: efflux RND transporter periplasmic adaptor subunit [Putridiphycobacter sp.]|nr:efflux RND transporter periplasmic adaptor subunit [Putridiphycobacter sp.]
MKTIIKQFILLITTVFFIVSCGGSGDGHSEEDGHDHGHNNGDEHKGEHGEEIHLSAQQFMSLNIKVDSLPMRNMNSFVTANGELEVPPQNEAEVTAVIGANVKSIKVIEGEKVKKGQVLAYLTHPNLIQLQTDYITNWNELSYLKTEFNRQEKLYGEKVGSGKEFQKVTSELNVKKGIVAGLKAQLKILGISTERLEKNEISEMVAVRSPISGFIRLVEVKLGQYVSPETSLFEIVNAEHVHADLMVFEKDAHKIKVGQKVIFNVQSVPDEELTAEIYSVGQNFEQDPKAIHVHAEIENKDGKLIPGMYVKGKIYTDNVMSYAIPEEGLVREGEKYFIFSAKKEMDHDEEQWAFEPIEVMPGISEGGWVEIKLLTPLDPNIKIAWNNAYNLIAEMKKGEAEHSH